MRRLVDGEYVDLTTKEAADFIESQPGIAPFYRKVSIKQILYAINRLELREAWDKWLATESRNTQDYFIVESDTMEQNPKLARGATAIGVKVADLVDLALTL